MIHVSLHDDASADLEAHRVVDPAAVADMAVFLQEAKGAGDRVADVLTTTGDVGLGRVRLNVKEWRSAQGMRRGPNLWRLRILDSPATMYRLIFGYHYQTRQLVVLAILRKKADGTFEADFDYDNLNSPIARRILAAWNGLA